MGLFNSKTPEQLAEEAKFRNMTPGQRVAHYYGVEDLDVFNLGIISDIAKDLKLERLGNMGAFLNGNDVQRLHDLQLLAGVQIQQNWILIRQLNEITKLLTTKDNIINTPDTENSYKNNETDDESKTESTDNDDITFLSLQDEFIHKAKACNSAKEIYEYLIEYNKIHENAFSPELIESIKKITLTERLYGNMHDECIKAVQDFL